MKKNTRKTVTNNTAVVAKRYHHEYKLRNIFDRLVLCDNPKYMQDYAIWLIDEGQGYMDEDERLDEVLKTKNLIQPTLSNETTNILLKAITNAIHNTKGEGKICCLSYQVFMKEVASNIAVELDNLDNDKVKFIASTQAKIQNIWTNLDDDSAMLLSIGLLCAKVAKGISKNRVKIEEEYTKPKKTEKESKPGLNFEFSSRVEDLIDRAGVRRHPRPDYMNKEVEKVDVDEIIPAEKTKITTKNQSKVEAKIIEEMNRNIKESAVKGAVDLISEIIVDSFIESSNNGTSISSQILALGETLKCKLSDEQRVHLLKMSNTKAIELLQRVIKPVIEGTLTMDEIKALANAPENISITNDIIGGKFVKNIINRILGEVDKELSSGSNTDDIIDTTEVTVYNGKRTKLCELNRDEVEAYYYAEIEKENLTRKEHHKLSKNSIMRNVEACICFHKFDENGNQIKCLSPNSDEDCSNMNLSPIGKAS